jgi:hypothetical protein
MTRIKFDPRQAGWPLCIAFALAAILGWLLARDHGVFPTVFADEMLYSAFARLTPLSEARIPSYLYLSTYSLTNACGTGFLGCARLFNTLFLVGAAPFIYLVARSYMGRGLALFVMLASMLSPINSYTAFFMPETMYFFAFFVLSWIALTRGHWRWTRQAVVSGLLLGLMSLVKVHALFLVPALAVFMAWRAWPNKGAAAGAALLAASVAVGVKYAVGFALAGEQGLSLFGSFYGAQATNSASRALSMLLEPGFISLRGHLMAMALLFGLPMALLAQSLLSGDARREAGDKAAELHAYTFLMLGAAIAMTIVYTATIAHMGPRETVRLHMRYYDFAFPLLYIVAAAAIGAAPGQPRKILRWLVAAALTGAVMLAMLKIPTYFLGMVDGPEIASLDLRTAGARALAAVGTVAVLMWAMRLRAAPALYLFVLVPGLLWTYQARHAEFQAQVAHAGLFDKAGLAIRDHVPADERGDIRVVGTSLAELMRAQYHIDARGVTLQDIPENAPFELAHLPVRKKWLAVIGPHPLPAGLTPVLRTPELALVKIGASHRTIAAVPMNGAPTGSLLAGIEGMAGPEPWGRWSNAKEVVLRFKEPLPRRLNVVLVAQAYGPNDGQQFIARVGAAEQRFTIPTTASEVFLHFETDGKQDTLRIEVPQPTSPESQGHCACSALA